MKLFHEILCVIMASAKASSNQNQVLGKTRAVISHAFCDSSLSAEDKIAKKTLDDVHTYAKLKHDPRAFSWSPN